MAKIKTNFLGYVINNNPTKYPDGDSVGDIFYKKPSGINVWEKKSKGDDLLIGYVTSDVSDAFPDDGEGGGFLYKRVDVGGIAWGTVTVSGLESITVEHGLGTIPKFVGLFAQKMTSWSQTFEYSFDETYYDAISSTGFGMNASTTQGITSMSAYTPATDTTITFKKTHYQYGYNGTYVWMALA